ncbi:MAG: LysM peptidoglycan-binding domain-containing M23 family metallopeptidase [Elusimicrobia bacterium]|nr:LysM peptidoglycan-binding domain-containing M23 family metallopeptidase [Elusimicrobiota bacterium]
MRASWIAAAFSISLVLVCAKGLHAGLGTTSQWERYSVLTSAGPDKPSAQVLSRLKRLAYTQHKIEKGEYSASALAKAYGTSLESLQATNDDQLLFLYPGRKITVQNKEGMLYEVKRASETLERVVRQLTGDGQQRERLKEKIAYANRLPGSALLWDYEFKRGDRVLIPGARRTFDSFTIPVQGGWRISSRFGRRFHPVLKRRKLHEGVDIAKPWGSPVISSRDGTVIEAGWREGYGMIVVIRHADGSTTRYGHLSAIDVQVGDRVKGRKRIGKVGSSGLSTGPHLHFEVRDRKGRAVNPSGQMGRGHSQIRLGK